MSSITVTKENPSIQNQDRTTVSVPKCLENAVESLAKIFQLGTSISEEKIRQKFKDKAWEALKAGYESDKNFTFWITIAKTCFLVLALGVVGGFLGAIAGTAIPVPGVGNIIGGIVGAVLGVAVALGYGAHVITSLREEGKI